MRARSRGALDAPLRRAPRVPPNYRFVLDVLQAKATDRHLTMNEIAVEARRLRPSIGFSTVYRALVRLRELGLVSEILVPGALSALYEPAAPEHAHFRCSRCGGVRDVDYRLSPALVARLATLQDAQVDSVSLTLHGVCRRCRLD